MVFPYSHFSRSLMFLLKQVPYLRCWTSPIPFCLNRSWLWRCHNTLSLLLVFPIMLGLRVIVSPIWLDLAWTTTIINAHKSSYKHLYLLIYKEKVLVSIISFTISLVARRPTQTNHLWGNISRMNILKHNANHHFYVICS